MALQSDRWIRQMAKTHGMIEPFVEGQVRHVDGEKIISYGLSSYGYDLRVAREFKVFTNINNSIIDPKTSMPMPLSTSKETIASFRPTPLRSPAASSISASRETS